MKKTLLAIVALATAVTMNAGAFNFARRVLTPSSTIKVAQKSTADAFAMLRTYGAPQKAKSLNDLAKEYVTVNILPTTKCVTNHEVTVTVGTEPTRLSLKICVVVARKSRLLSTWRPAHSQLLRGKWSLCTMNMATIFFTPIQPKVEKRRLTNKNPSQV